MIVLVKYTIIGDKHIHLDTNEIRGRVHRCIDFIVATRASNFILNLMQLLNCIRQICTKPTTTWYTSIAT